MKTKEFGEWLKGLADLNRNQQKIVVNQINTVTSKDAVTQVLDSNIPKNCPRCQSSRIGLWGRQSGLQRYRCKDCCKCFNSLSGTSLARLRHKEVWLDYSQALIAGITIRDAAKLCGVHKTTSFRWRHRFLNPIAKLKPTGLMGIVEADETFFPRSFKGSLELPRPAHHRGHDDCRRGTGEDKVPVLILRDRHKTTTDFKLMVANQLEEVPIIRQVVAKDAILCSDGASSLKGAARQAGIAHRAVNLSAGVRVLGGVYHVQNVNAYDSRLKTWMKRFHGVATKYLENYLGWRRGLEKWREHLSPSLILQAAIGQC